MIFPFHLSFIGLCMKKTSYLYRRLSKYMHHGLDGYEFLVWIHLNASQRNGLSFMNFLEREAKQC